MNWEYGGGSSEDDPIEQCLVDYAPARYRLLDTADLYAEDPFVGHQEKLKVATFIASIDFSKLAMAIVGSDEIGKMDKVDVLNDILDFEEKIRVGIFNDIAGKEITDRSVNRVDVDYDVLAATDEDEIVWLGVANASTELHGISLRYDVRKLMEHVDGRNRRRSRRFNR